MGTATVQEKLENRLPKRKISCRPRRLGFEKIYRNPYRDSLSREPAPSIPSFERVGLGMREKIRVVRAIIREKRSIKKLGRPHKPYQESSQNGS